MITDDILTNRLLFIDDIPRNCDMTQKQVTIPPYGYTSPYDITNGYANVSAVQPYIDVRASTSQRMYPLRKKGTDYIQYELQKHAFWLFKYMTAQKNNEPFLKDTVWQRIGNRMLKYKKDGVELLFTDDFIHNLNDLSKIEEES